MSLRAKFFSVVRRLHATVADKGLPDRIAIYLHALEESEMSAFRKMVVALKELKYDFCTPDDFLSSDSGKKVFLSFDDNYLSWYNALNELRELGVIGTFYVNTLPIRDTASPAVQSDFFDRIHFNGVRKPLSRQEIAELSRAGHVVACHSHSHFVLSKLESKEARGEISLCKSMLEDIISAPVVHFSYPYGMRRHFSDELKQDCLGLGFRSIATARPGHQHRNIHNGYIHRTLWRLDTPVEENLLNLRINGRVFETVTGRSPIG